MEYLGLVSGKSLVPVKEVEKDFENIINRVKNHRRKIHENQLPDKEEIAFMNDLQLVNGNFVINNAPANPSVYLGEGDYKVVITAKSLSSNKVNLIVNLNRLTSPMSNPVVINQALTTEFKTFEHNFKVAQMGTYKVLPKPSVSSEKIEISQMEIWRVW